MAKERTTHPDAKPKQNPLGSIGRKPGSYVGDLDSLLAEVGDDPAAVSVASANEQQTVTLAERQGNGGEAMPSKPPMKRINLDVPSDLHQRFKGASGMAGRTMTDVLQQLIREYLGETSG